MGYLNSRKSVCENLCLEAVAGQARSGAVAAHLAAHALLVAMASSSARLRGGAETPGGCLRLCVNTNERGFGAAWPH